MHPDIDLKSFFRDIRDFPRPGIVFKDLTPLLASPAAREAVVQTMLDQVTSLNIDAVAAIEARGFLFGMLLAERLQVPFIPVRKEGKLPYRKSAILTSWNTARQPWKCTKMLFRRECGYWYTMTCSRPEVRQKQRAR